MIVREYEAKMVWFVCLVAVWSAFSLLVSAQLCPTPVTRSVIATSPTIDLPSNQYGSDVVAAGANVMVMWNDASGTYSQFSFAHGVAFPAGTRRTLTTVPRAQVKLGLVSDGRDVIAVGQFGDRMMHLDYNFGDFSWSNGSTIFPTAVQFMHCSAKLGLFVCALGQPGFDGGVRVYTLDAVNNNQTLRVFKPVWTRRTAEDMPTCNVRPSVATDGTTFMVCSAGFLVSNRMVCSYSLTGISEYLNTAQDPVPGSSVTLTTEVRLASNGIRGSYVMAYVQASTTTDIRTVVTVNLGATWTAGNPLFQSLDTTLPRDLVFVNRYMSMRLVSSQAVVSFQNASTPLQWTTREEFTPGTRYSLATGSFGTNYYVATKTPTNEIVVTACIPTAAPTIFTTRSPTREDVSSAGSFVSASSLVLFTLAVSSATAAGLLLL